MFTISTLSLPRLRGRSCLLAGVALSLGAPLVARAEEAPAPQADNPASEIIVTGTRETGTRARNSATPIDVVGAKALNATGRVNLLDALKDILPSVNAPAVGYDVGALARTFQLRGLSPDQTLVLVNGKRRHTSASIYADSDPAQGSNVVDLDLIPANAIDHVEVLRDGAAAQYGSDAIAGVVNVILKNGAAGGELGVQGGTYYKGDGANVAINVDHGVKIGAEGALHLSAGYRLHDFSNRSGDSGGAQPAQVQGDPRSILFTGAYDYTQPLADHLTLYSFGTWASRQARANENPREPGSISDAVDALYPNGFTPRETVNEHDFSVTAGLKGGTAWAFDLSTTYGRNSSILHNVHTVNPDLLADTGNAQSVFYVGGYASSEWTSNLDIRRSFDIGLAGPLTLAFGAENRYETYEIRAGEANSYYLGGASAFPGYRPSDATQAHRNSIAGYVDATAHPLKGWELSLAGRVEHYDSVGSRVNGKVATRYDISPRLALRGSASTGFHAPSLAQEYYSATTVTTGYASIQLPVNSAGARLLGAPALKPETSRNYSIGLVVEPVKGLHLSVDVYRIDIDNRIIETEYLYGALAQAAVAANGSAIPAGLDPDNVAAQFFTNGVDTRTQGVDVTATWRTDLGDWGTIGWNAGFGYVDTAIRRFHAAPAALQAAGLSLEDAVEISNITTATPHTKLSLAANWQRGPWAVTLRNTYYSNSTQYQGYASPYYIYTTGNRVITDLDVGYQLSARVRVGAGANNLFNIYPRRFGPEVYQNVNYDQYSHLSPFGINGGSYYLRLTVSL
ncbi:MAG TPA: TonB-dependent receptor [Novosphingobium sp.]|nr:TonB-dependent receptor [Novosphingobium sp.]